MAISRTPALFARVDLFSRSRVIICYLREIIFSCRRKRHWKHCKLWASCIKLLREVSRATDGLLDKFGTQVNFRRRERQKTIVVIVLISKTLALHVHYTLWYYTLGRRTRGDWSQGLVAGTCRL